MPEASTISVQSDPHAAAKLPTTIRDRAYTWSEVTRMVMSHRRELVAANLIAILGALVAVPVPLLIPLLVDEVLLGQPGQA